MQPLIQSKSFSAISSIRVQVDAVIEGVVYLSGTIRGEHGKRKESIQR
jgi:hypothetical protein